ncbi:hypothetical protein E1262_27175 [Jiangella aurantiaca]|uniref:Uncharacterized protein n=1 Tax=Jiangella aurantiaca TaxID=2530373 RepID=A0A4R5A293_9ACTN|nr:hypothetical protein [Jiangella aurantiaca]TDD64774.1 hypothetical protein E1262_27175 [Jiangella aurantiaca]
MSPRPRRRRTGGAPLSTVGQDRSDSVTVAPLVRRRIRDDLVEHAPAGWARIVVEATGASGMTSTRLSVITADGDDSHDGVVPDDTLELISDLRDDCYREGRGTWYNATFTVDVADEDLRVELDYDNPPMGGVRDPAKPDSEDDAADDGDATIELLLDDHELYPRDPEQLPDWHPLALEARSPQLFVNAVRDQLLASAPEGWQQLTMTVSSAMYYSETTITTVMDDGTTSSAAGPRLDGRLVFAARRAHLNRHGRPWYTATITLTAGGDVAAEFDDANPPFGGLWSADNPDGDAHPEMLRSEHQRVHTGTLDHLPDWHPARTRPWGVSIYWLEMLRLCAVDAAPEGWRHLVLDVEGAGHTVRVRLHDIGGENPAADYAAAFEADAESIDIVNDFRFNTHVYAPVPGTWYSARFMIDQPDHPDRILIDELDFTTRPFTKIPRHGDDPDSDEHRELLLDDHWRHPREPADLPSWHPALAAGDGSTT